MLNTDVTRRMFLGTVGASLALSDLKSVDGQGASRAAGDTSGPIEKDVVFGKGGDVDLHCDIYRPPPGVTKRMAVIHFHGGGFAIGSKSDLADRLKPFSALGYVNIAAQYRLAGVAKWPAQIEDVKTAIRWTRANGASLGIDARRIAVAGYSAGGHLALFAAGTQNHPEFEGNGGNKGVGTDVAACLAYYAVTGPAWERFRNAFPLPEGSSEEVWRQATPAPYIRGFPPTVLHHGLTDTTIRAESSQDFLTLLRQADIPAELHTFAGVSHEFVIYPEFAEATARLNDLFFDRYVLNPRTYPPFGAGRGGTAPRP